MNDAITRGDANKRILNIALRENRCQIGRTQAIQETVVSELGPLQQLARL